MRTLARYTLFQVPGWLIVAVCLYWWWPLSGYGYELGLAVFAAWVAKDFALFPLVRRAYEPASGGDPSGMVGRKATIVSSAGETEAFVRVVGERWQCRVEPGQAPLDSGSPVVVVDRDGLVLVVRGLS